MERSHVRHQGHGQVQLDLTEIKEHLGIPPRDDQTRDEVEQLEQMGATTGSS